MPIPNQVARIALIGHTTGGEVFETGYWITAAIQDQAEAMTVAQQVATAFQSTARANYCAVITPDCGYDRVRVYAYLNGGPAASAIGEHAIAGAAGTGTGTALPLQVSMCVTLRTPMPGRRHRGRMYLPFLSGTAMNGHQFVQGICTSIAQSTADFFEAVKDAIQAGGNATIVSQAGTTHTNVSSVAVDSRPDVQRRRANKQTASFTESAPVSANP